MLVLFEDHHLIAVNKPAGVLTQAPAGVPSLEADVKAYIKEKYAKPAGVYLGIPHRLDRAVVSCRQEAVMPIHDWTRVDAGLFHHFHERWIAALCDTLNGGLLPTGFVALADQVAGGPIPDVLTLNRRPKGPGKGEPTGGLAVAPPPRARFVDAIEEDTYARRANRVRIQHRHGEVVAVIEIVSPGNKNTRTALRAFVRKASDLLWQGIHLLVVDLFPPSDRDPQGIHKAIWDEIAERQFELPPDKPLTVAGYRAVPTKTAYVEPVAVGDDLPGGLPIFLTEDDYVLAPLEETYQTSWVVFPADFKELLELPAGG
jgi:Protein of unknown function (DUF4058)